MNNTDTTPKTLDQAIEACRKVGHDRIHDVISVARKAVEELKEPCRKEP